MNNNHTIPSHFESLYPDTTRSEEIKQILALIKAGSSCQVIALPGVGKNNLMEMLSYNRNIRIKHLGDHQKWFHFVYMDFSEVRKRSLSDITKFILLSLAHSLSERGLDIEYEKVHGYLKEAIDLGDELILFQALKKSIDYLAIEKELTIVFLCDRFEQYIPDVTDQFFLHLKILRNRAKYRFSVVFPLTRPLEELLERWVFSEFYEFLGEHTVYLSLHDPVGLAFRFDYLEKITGERGSEAVKKEVVRLCGGHGKLSRLAFEAVLASPQPPTISDLCGLLLNQKTIQGALFEIWNALTPSEHTFLKQLVQKDTVEETNHTYLTHVGLIKDGKIAIPLFEEFIKKLPWETTQPFNFDAEKNEILKGSEPIGSRLSPSEFRLFRFLLQNPERVCEKDECIAAVWKDVKTQQGVTDQALDQIIYRLRKKVEDDPNSPLHIQTVKGRGVRFVP